MAPVGTFRPGSTTPGHRRCRRGAVLALAEMDLKHRRCRSPEPLAELPLSYRRFLCHHAMVIRSLTSLAFSTRATLAAQILPENR
jgi:hypothetical protein